MNTITQARVALPRRIQLKAAQPAHARALGLLASCFALLCAPVLAQSTPGDFLFRDLFNDPTGGSQVPTLRVLVARVVYLDQGNPLERGQVEDSTDDLREILNKVFRHETSSRIVDVQLLPEDLELNRNASVYMGLGTGATARLRGDLVEELAANHQIDLDAEYDREVFVSAKTWPGVDSIGTINHRTVFSARENSTRAGTWTHELGHANDWQHANMWETPIIVPADFEDPFGLTTFNREYRDRFDTMGDDTSGFHFNPFYQWRAGLLDDSDILFLDHTANLPPYINLQMVESAPGASPYPSAIRMRSEYGRDVWIYYRGSEGPLEAERGLGFSWGYRTNFHPMRLLDVDDPATPPQNKHADAFDAPLQIVEDPFESAQLPVFIVEALPPLLEYKPWGPPMLADIRVRIDGEVGEFSTPPIIDVVQPAVGVTLPVDPPTSTEFTYEVTAYAPDGEEPIGHVFSDGENIDTISFYLYEGSNVVLDSLIACLSDPLESNPCPSVPFIGMLENVVHPFQWTFDTAGVSDGKYVLVIVAQSTPHPTTMEVRENTIWFNHLIDRKSNAPMYVPTPQ